VQKGLLESQATGSDFSCGVDEDPEEILDYEKGK
jgi:hypothetical protein